MATPVSICSNALLMLGAAPISSFTEAGDRPKMCANLYPTQRDATIRAHPWNCCTKRVSLAPLSNVTDAPAYGWQNKFVLPGDWIRTIRVGSAYDNVQDFRPEGRFILANGSALTLRYVFLNDNEGTYDALLVDVLTKRMAWALCYAVTKSTSLRDSMGAEFRLALQQAKSIDSMEAPQEDIADDSPLISIRY